VRREQQLRELTDTHAALRLLPMLVARGEPPEAVFAAATATVAPERPRRFAHAQNDPFCVSVSDVGTSP
jgi:hypothetical protein